MRGSDPGRSGRTGPTDGLPADGGAVAANGQPAGGSPADGGAVAANGQPAGGGTAGGGTAGGGGAAGGGAVDAAAPAAGRAAAVARVTDGGVDRAARGDAGEPPAAREPESAPARRGPVARWLTSGGTVAVVAWLIATPVAFVLPALAHRDPFSIGASTIPLAAAFCLVAAFALVAVRWSGEIVAGAAAGLGAAWTVLMLRSALYGTPFGFGGLVGDMSRMSAAATRYTVTAASSDFIIPGLASEYPPFYPWLIGRASLLTDQPAWRLLGDAEVLVISAAVLAAFLLWRRQVGSWAALAIAALTQVTWSDPRKAFEVVSLAIFVPWVIEVFGRPARTRLHWLPAGLLGGLIAIVYQAWVVYAVFGILALVVIAWRSEPDRWAYLRRLVLVGAVAAVVSSWYVIPFVWTKLTKGGAQVSDLYPSTSINTGLFPFLEPTPMGVLQLIGLVGLVLLWRATWWARPLLLLVVGVYAYRLMSMVRYIGTHHTAFLHYTSRLYGVMLTVAGVLVLTHVVPLLLRRMRFAPPRFAAAAVLVVALAWSASAFTLAWMPESGSAYAKAAHAEPLPDGGYPRYAPTDIRRPWFPVTPVRQAVERVLGPDPRRVTLSADDRLYAYLPWPGFIDNDRTAASTVARWDDRRAVLRELGATTDPAAFASRSASTGFGPIDIFVLHKDPDGWAWGDQRFTPAQFAPRYWTVVDGLPEDVVVAIRR